MAGTNQPLESVTNPDAGDRSAKSNSAQTDDILMAEVHRARMSSPNAGRACQLAVEQSLHLSPDIFEVKSGRFRGIEVPENLRCGIFQSNIARAAGLIRPRDVTVRALEFGKLMHDKGYREEGFNEHRNYPDGTYIVGNGSNDGTNSRHVGMVCGGRLIHTHKGKVVNQAISEKFYPGAYDRIRVFIPPAGRRTAEIDPDILNA